MKKNKKNELLVNCINQNSNDSEPIIGTEIGESKKNIPGKSKYISEIEKKFDIIIEPQIIICGIDETVLKFNNTFEKYLYFWSPTPKECFENTTSHNADIDLVNFNCFINFKLLELSAFNKNIYKSDGSQFEMVNVLISISKNGVTKQFRIDHPKVAEMFELGLYINKYFKKRAKQIKDYFNSALSSNPKDLEDWVANYLNSIN